MDKLKAAQRMLGFHTGGYVSNLPPSDPRRYIVDDSESQPGPATPFIGFSRAEICKHFGVPFIDDSESTPGPVTPFVDFKLQPLAIERTTRLQLEVLALQELLNEKDAEIDRLLEPELQEKLQTTARSTIDDLTTFNRGLRRATMVCWIALAAMAGFIIAKVIT